MGKRKIMLVLLAVCLLACAACATKTKIKTETATGFCAEAARLSESGFIAEAYCADGLLRTQDHFMTFYEYDGGPSYPLCSASYCEHKHLSASMEGSSCEAALPNLRAAVIVGNMLYTLQEPTMGKTLVSRRNLLESGYEQLVELPYRLTFPASGEFTQEKAYLIMTDYAGNMDGLYKDSDYPCVYVELDLKKGTYRELFRQEDVKEQIFTVRRMKDGYALYCMKQEGAEFIFDAQGNPITDDEGKVALDKLEYYEYFYFVDRETLSVKKVEVMMPDGGRLKYTHYDYNEELGLDAFTVCELQGKPLFIGFGEELIYAQQGNGIITVDPKTEECKVVWTAPEDVLLYIPTVGLTDDFFLVTMRDREDNKDIRLGVLMRDTWELRPYSVPENHSGMSYLCDGYFVAYFGVESDGMMNGHQVWTKLVKRLISYEDILGGYEHYKLEWEER